MWSFGSNDSLYNECMKLDNTKIIGDITVKSFSGITTSEMCSPTNVNLKEKWIVRTGGEGYAPGLQYSYKSESPESENFFDQILSTFKFTDSINNVNVPINWKEYTATDSEFGIKTTMFMPPGFSFKFTGSEFTIQNDSDATELWDYSTSVTTGSNNVLKNYYDGGSRREWYKRYLDGEFLGNTVDKKFGDIVSMTETVIGNTSYLKIVVNTLSRGIQTHYVYLQNDIIHIIKPISDVAETSQAKFPQHVGLSLYSLKSIQTK